MDFVADTHPIKESALIPLNILRPLSELQNHSSIPGITNTLIERVQQLDLKVSQPYEHRAWTSADLKKTQRLPNRKTPDPRKKTPASNDFSIIVDEPSPPLSIHPLSLLPSASQRTPTAVSRFKKPAHELPVPPNTPVSVSSLPHQFHSTKHQSRVNKVPRTGYRAYPAFKQAMTDRDRNHREEVESLRSEYQEKRDEDVKDVIGLMKLLLKALDDQDKRSDENERMAKLLQQIFEKVIQQSVDLQWRNEEAIRLHERAATFSRCQEASPSDKLSRIVTLAADLVKQEGEILTALNAMHLHRRMVPFLNDLIRELSIPGQSYAPVNPDPSALKYYENIVHETQRKLYDHEWNEIKNERALFELDDLPPNPAPPSVPSPVLSLDYDELLE